MTAYRLDAWALLGDASRRAIIARLSQSPCSVAALSDDMPISRPAVSQHLKVLREAGIVHDQRQGRQRVYSIDTARLERDTAWRPRPGKEAFLDYMDWIVAHDDFEPKANR